MALHTRAGPGGAGPAVLWAAERAHLCPLTSPTGSVVCLQGVRVGFSGDRGVTDLSSAGAHHRLLLSRPPPRRTVGTLLEKQNWGVRHGGYPASPTPTSGGGGSLQGRGPPAWRDKFGARGAALGTHLLWGLQGKSLLTNRDPRNSIRLMTTSFCPSPRSEEAAETQRPQAGSGACANTMCTGRPSAPRGPELCRHASS